MNLHLSESATNRLRYDRLTDDDAPIRSRRQFMRRYLPKAWAEEIKNHPPTHCPRCFNLHNWRWFGKWFCSNCDWEDDRE